MRMASLRARRYSRVSHTITGLCHSRVPLGKKRLASAGAISIEKTMAPNRAKATVQAMGLNKRPSTRCNVKMGR